MTSIPEPAAEPVTADAGRIFAGPESLAGVVRAAFGPGPRLAAVDRLRGGSKKGVYRPSRLTSRWSRTCPVSHWRRGWNAAGPVRIRHWRCWAPPYR
jgi:hypothetical protein